MLGPRDARQDPLTIWRSRQCIKLPSKLPQYLNNLSSKFRPLWNRIYLGLSENEDKAWPTERTNEGIQAENEAKLPQYPKTILNADPVLLRTQDLANSAELIDNPISVAQCQIYGSTIGLPGTQSQDKMKTLKHTLRTWSLENHDSCSNHDMTTSGHGNNALTHSGF